jgi:hypothetical protein
MANLNFTAAATGIKRGDLFRLVDTSISMKTFRAVLAGNALCKGISADGRDQVSARLCDVIVIG